MTTRALLAAAAALSCTFAAATSLSAQTADSTAAPARHSRWELVVPTGTLLPTGAQRDAIKRGNLTAAQLAFVPRSSFAVTATFGWARSRDLATTEHAKLDVFTYDVGAEVRAPRWRSGDAVSFAPFAGVGAGGRSYSFRGRDVDATHALAAYGALGGELGVRRVRLRVEARDYVTGSRPLGGVGGTAARNDVVVMAGLRLVRR